MLDNGARLRNSQALLSLDFAWGSARLLPGKPHLSMKRPLPIILFESIAQALTAILQ
jgi:hypothetical protein